MCDIPTFEPHIRLLEQWRDFDWRMYLLMREDNNTSWKQRYWHRSHAFDFAVKILKGNAPVPKDERLDEFRDVQFGQYPGDFLVPEMD